jgi:beta-lactamase class A
MNSQKMAKGPEGGRTRRVRVLFVLTILIWACLAHAADDLLKGQFAQKLRSIAETSDAVVGIAIKNMATGEKIFINENVVFPQASSIKIHILAELFHQAEQGKVRLSDIVPLPAAVRVGGSGVLNELGESSVSMSIRDYAVLMIVLSDNTATNFLIKQVGMENVNKFLELQGAVKTRLQRMMMDVKAAAEGRENIGTPKEVLMILEKLYRGELVNKKSSEDMLSILQKPKEGPIRAGVPADISIANKEGDIEGVRCDVGIVYLPKAPYVICVMSKLLAKESDGPRIITEISRMTYQYFERKANSNEFGRRIPK